MIVSQRSLFQRLLSLMPTLQRDIIGLAASAATVVVGGANVVKMRDTATFMIHDPSTIAYGTIDEMQQIVDILRTVKETILNGYEAKTGLKREKLSQLMQDETWMTAQQAKEFGFVDEVISGEKPKAVAKNLRAVFVNCLKGYEKAPADMIDQIQEEDPDPEETVIPTEEPASEGAEADNAAPAEGAEAKPQDGAAKEAALLLRQRVHLILSGDHHD